MNTLKQLLFAWVQYRHFQAIYGELTRMSETELAERGIARQDIGWAAFREAERRTEASLTWFSGRATYERGAEASA